jgi:hypothetical protein
MSDQQSSNDTTDQTPPKAGSPAQKPKIEVVFVPEPTDDMAEVVQLEELIPDDGLDENDAAADAKQPRGGDFLASTALVVLLGVMTAILVVVGVTSFGAQAIACSDGAGCNGGVITLATQLVVVGLPLLLIATIVVTVLRIVRRTLAFPVALIGIAVCVLVYVVAAFLVAQSVPS